MAIKKIHEEKNGVIGYVITKEEDLEKLPKNGIAITSRAILVNPTIGVKTYIFYDNDVDKNTDGEWIEWKSKYRGLGDNVKEYIKEYHEDLNKIVDVTNPKIGEGYDVTINGSEEGVLSFGVNGRTIQNLLTKGMFDGNQEAWNTTLNPNEHLFENGYVTMHSNSGNYVNLFSKITNLFKPSTTYTIIFDVKENTLEGRENYRFALTNGISIFNETIGKDVDITKGIHLFKVTTKDDVTEGKNLLRSFVYNSVSSGLITFKYMILEGDYTNTPIEALPFVEGIQSVGDLVEDESNVNFGKYKVEVKSVGKNLFNLDLRNEQTYLILQGVDMIRHEGYVEIKSNTFNGYNYFLTNGVKLKPNTSYTLTIDSYMTCRQTINLCNNNHQDSSNYGTILLDTNRNVHIKNFVTDNNGMFYLSAYTDVVKDELNSIFIYSVQLEEGTTATPYEPYHEDIKTYYLDEPLRGLPNKVCDTIEKDKVVRRVGKVVLDGSESWELSDAKFTNSIRFRILSIPFKQKSYGISNLFIYKEDTGVDYECFTLASDGAIHIRVLRSKLSTEDINGFKTWLQSNPTTVYYELAEPTEEQLPTIPTISSYNDVTHIYSTNYIQPFINIYDTVSIFKDANQYLNIECDRTFALPNMEDLEDNAVKEIHMYIYMKEEATLTFPSDIKWETLSEFGKGDYVEIILTYVETNGVGQWLGSAIVYNG